MPNWDFDSIYNSFSRLVYWAAYGIVKNEADALDISQTVFLRAFSSLSKLSQMDEPQIKSWLYRVTINACTDGFRKKRREDLTNELPELIEADEAVLPEENLLSNIEHQRIRQAVDSLPDIYREAVVLHYFSGLNYAEIAALNGSAEGTVKSRISRAKQRLYTILNGGAEE